MLLNLAGNALKFTEQGGASVIVEPGIWPDEVTFLVRDTGIGIAPAEQARIFLEFEQADSGLGRKFSGTGLGLAISKRIIERMGGRIGVDSSLAAGSTFHFTVRLPHATDNATARIRGAQPRWRGGADRGARRRRGFAGGAAPDAVGRENLRRRRREVAAAVLPEQAWTAILIDHALGTHTVKALLRSAEPDRAPDRADHAERAATSCRRSSRRASPAIW